MINFILTMKNKSVMYEALKRARKESREEEIRLYGKLINHNKIFKNKIPVS